MARKLKLMGKKRGMVQIFDEDGRRVACTVIEMEPNVVVDLKTTERDGYSALQLGFERVSAKDPRTVKRRVGKAQSGHFDKQGVEPRRHLCEARVDSSEEYSVGQEIGSDYFNEFNLVDVTATSKGKGTQGVQKRYGYRGGPASHGSGFHRAPGSLGNRTTPGRVFKNKPLPGRMGNETVTVQNLQVVRLPEGQEQNSNVLIVKGAVPGAVGSLVYVQPAVKAA